MKFGQFMLNYKKKKKKKKKSYMKKVAWKVVPCLF